MTQCSKLVDDSNLCGEGPLWDPGKQIVYWTDNTGHRFFSYDWRTRHRDVLLENFEVTGAAFNQPGGFVLISNSGVWLWDQKTPPVLLADHAGDAKLQLNDCIADPRGRLLAGSCFYNPAEKYPLGKIFSVQPDGRIEILDEGFQLANGFGFSGDQKTLYFTDSAARIIYAYDYDATAGKASNRRVFVKVDSTAGLPDGLTVDAEDFVWSAEWYGSCITRYDPDGKIERRVPIPAKQTSSLIFGGPEYRDIFVTSAANSEATPIMPSGYDPNTGYFGGALFHLNLGVQGRPEFVANIRKAG
jgi:D-xylonolactonase